MVEVEVEVGVALGRQVHGERARVEPCPEIGQVFEDVGAGVFGDQAVVWEDGDGAVAVDEGDPEGGDPVGIEAVAGDLIKILVQLLVTLLKHLVGDLPTHRHET
jgi:hypothetical protein